MVEIYLLEQLDAFARCGTLSAAAEELHMTQPSLSRAMQKIEAELGVALFDRSKNRLSLNETGKLAASYAQRILASERDMAERVRTFDRSLRTVSVGSCAPGPLMKLLPRVTGSFSDQTVTSEIVAEDTLLQGLRDNIYQLVILSSPTDDKTFVCARYLTEHLYLSVNAMHPASAFDSISFAQTDGQNFIMYAKVGIWERLVREKMPHAHFFKQEDLEAVSELASSSDLPTFATDITIEEIPARSERINVPYSDKEATATFYVACLRSNYPRFGRLIESIASTAS